MRKADGFGLAGLLLVLTGGYLLFSSEPPFSLWIAWLLGPLCWYGGMAVLIGWCLNRFLLSGTPREKPVEVRQPEPVNAAASGRNNDTVLLREVPAMGAFIMMLLVCLALPAQGQAASAGAAVFTGKCAMCHGQDGAGKTMMGAKLGIRDLRSAEVQKLTDGELVKIVGGGKDKMPAYNGKLSGQQITDAVGYVRELAKQH